MKLLRLFGSPAHHFLSNTFQLHPKSHGFSAMAQNILDEVLGFRPDYIEHQLAHAVRDPNGRAYNRTAHLPERRKMMQEYADYFDKLKVGAEVIPINRSA